MRTWGRPQNPDGTRGAWQEISTTLDGFNDAVYIATLCQVLLLNLGESPFYGNYGIPQQQTMMTNIYPDYYLNYTQRQFAPYFASLIISREPVYDPTYSVQVLTQQGYVVNASVPVPY